MDINRKQCEAHYIRIRQATFLYGLLKAKNKIYTYTSNNNKSINEKE